MTCTVTESPKTPIHEWSMLSVWQLAYALSHTDFFHIYDEEKRHLMWTVQNGIYGEDMEAVERVSVREFTSHEHENPKRMGAIIRHVGEVLDNYFTIVFLPDFSWIRYQVDADPRQTGVQDRHIQTSGPDTWGNFRPLGPYEERLLFSHELTRS